MSVSRLFRIAIDGPAGAGKSSTAKLVASLLSFSYIDSGAFYRCVALKALQSYPHLFDVIRPDGTTSALRMPLSDPHTASVIGSVATSASIVQVTDSLPPSNFKNAPFPESAYPILPTHRIFLDGTDVSSLIRTDSISTLSSSIAKIPAVREAVGVMQRAAGSSNEARGLTTGVSGLVMDGRDIGTHVFPLAQLKIFLVCAPEIRARRRLAELLLSPPPHPSYDQLLQSIIARDEQDTTREVSPLRKADDAVEVDSGERGMMEVAEEIVALARARME
ncbi:hypothetical protein HDU93_001880 [Gonapodya sp. JEL0774]|nr:hypothetical protein HDU93_001880 [Gonapodya sp. JEL0774]